jgi:hypothetical protein
VDDQKEDQVDLSSFDKICINIDPNTNPAEEAAKSAFTCIEAYKVGKRKCIWVSFHGYDDDPREVWDIPECRLWTRTFIVTLLTAQLQDKAKYMGALGDDRQGEGPGLGLPNLLGLGWGRAVGKLPHHDQTGRREDNQGCF